MKKLLLPSLMVAVCCSFLIACKKDGKQKTSTLSAKINNVMFTAGNVTTTFYTGYKIIQGSSGAETISLLVSDTSAIWGMGVYSANGTLQDSSNNFSVVNTSNSNSEEGYFDFTTKDSVVVTDGKYKIYW